MFHSLSGEDLKGSIPTQSELAFNPGQHFSVHQLKPIIRRGNYGGDSPSRVILFFFCVCVCEHYEYLGLNSCATAPIKN